MVRRAITAGAGGASQEPIPHSTAEHRALRAFDQASFSQFMKGRLAHSLDKDVADEIASPTAALKRVSSVGKKLDWIEPSLHLCNPGSLQRRGYDRVYDAFHLLHTEPSIQVPYII
ncbi:hypothetical protein Acr_00g0012100 [Actinidia rufa]|uniref:Uncharacterized protein n=1 Tax=Actinidia rufa TaxID=165716 RepID=A0A7J0D9L5_9ERIC|nr:hypothetical protein Acr_00g0012100 [Actinidia rufa]